MRPNGESEGGGNDGPRSEMTLLRRTGATEILLLLSAGDASSSRFSRRGIRRGMLSVRVKFGNGKNLIGSRAAFRHSSMRFTG